MCENGTSCNILKLDKGLQETLFLYDIPSYKKRVGGRLISFPPTSFRVNDGDRTRDNWNHNPGLYQLSYVHHVRLDNSNRMDKDT